VNKGRWKQARSGQAVWQKAVQATTSQSINR